MSYKAFISYSHKADGVLAPSIQGALQRFAKPFYRLRAIRVFRDDTALHLTPALWPKIQQALGESEYFILMASPEAAASKWVQDEVDGWLDLHEGSLDKFLIVLTRGEIVWDASAQDFDWIETTALPPNLQKKFKAEPLYLDFRWAREAAHLSLRDPQFLKAIGKLAAAVHDKPLDSMVGEDVVQHRVFKLVAGVIGVLLLALSVGASGAAYYANERRKEAETERKKAEEAADGQRKAREAEAAQRRQAEAARQYAEAQSVEARRQQQLAEEAAVSERKARLTADEQRRRAETQTKLATNMKMVGELYREVSTAEAQSYLDSFFESYKGDSVQRLYERILSKYRETGDFSGQASTLIAIANKNNSSQDGSHPAIGYYTEALALFRSTGNVEGEVSTLIKLAQAHESVPGGSETARYYDLAFKAYRREPAKVAEVLLAVGNMYAKKRNVSKGVEYLTKAAEAYREIGDPYGEGRSLSDLGHFYFSQFNSPEGAHNFRLSIPLLERSLPQLRSGSNRAKLAHTLEIIGTMSDIIQDKEKARHYYRLASSEYEALGQGAKTKAMQNKIKDANRN
jgi:tetratricopeptide (TPR) repeat protein